MQFVHGDFLKMRTKDWRDADVVFINSTCYDEPLMSKIADLAGRYFAHVTLDDNDAELYPCIMYIFFLLVGMKKGSFFMTLTKRLPCTDFVILEYELCKMSWGEATIFIMQKTTDPRSGSAAAGLSDDEGDGTGEFGHDDQDDDA